MHFDEYQKLANNTDQQPIDRAVGPNSSNMLVPLLGMVGELGEFLGEYKKWLRDGEAYHLFPERV